ncbi:hypothetical protein EDB19DRAFT_1713177, partial [Suillus lakei]
MWSSSMLWRVFLHGRCYCQTFERSAAETVLVISIHVCITSWVPASPVFVWRHPNQIFGRTPYAHYFQVSAGIHHDCKFSNYMQRLLKSLTLLFVGSHIYRDGMAHLAQQQSFVLYLMRLIGFHELYITVPTPCGRGTLQFRSSYLDKVIIHSYTLTSIGKIVEGWVVQCRSLWLLCGNPETALAVECALRKLDNHPYHSRLVWSI